MHGCWGYPIKGRARNLLSEEFISCYEFARFSFDTAMGYPSMKEPFYNGIVLTITPDVQLLFNPALNPDEDLIAIFGIRARIYF